MTTSNQNAVPGTVNIRLGVLSIASLLVTVAAVTALIVVASIREADTLSVVALALAIIAFSAQLIIYVVQAADSAAGARQSLELHVQLSGLLAELRERTGNTQRSMDSINSRLLEAVIGKEAIMRESGTDAGSRGSRDFAERVAEGYAEATRASSTEPPQVQATNRRRFPDALPSAQAEELHTFMSAWPDENDAAHVVSALKALKRAQLSSLRAYADDLFRSTRPDASLGPGLPTESDQIAHLIEKVRGWKLYTLNSEGRRLGRVFTAVDEPPRWAQPLLEIREALAPEEPVDYRDPDD